MRVICIDDTEQPIMDASMPAVKMGNIYTVIDSKKSSGKSKNGYTYPKGTYYILAECGDETGYHESMFVTINENQIDETEFERNYQKELV